METIEGKLLDIVYKNEENGFLVGKFLVDEKELTITGCMPTVNPLEDFSLEGEYIKHDVYGFQFKVNSFIPIIPSTKDAIIAYLSSGLIKGIKEKTAKKIVDYFKEDTLNIIEKEPHRLEEISGIGKKTIDRIKTSYSEGKALRNLIINLAPYSITPNYCMKIYKKYKDKSLEIVMQNPYRLSSQIHGIGFKIADKIGMSMGIDKYSKDRIKEGIIFELYRATGNGHTYLDIEDLVKKSSKLLEVEFEHVQNEIVNLALDSKIQVEKWDDGRRIYLLNYYESENDVCKRLISLSKSEIKTTKLDIEDELFEIQKEEKISLAKNQELAVLESFKNNILIITGGPGTGKTTTINTIIKLFKRADNKILLCAPTGRAAKRMSETTKMEAKTIHRALEMGFSLEDELVFLKNEEDKLDYDVIIVDEMSMVDINLMSSFLQAIKHGTKLIFVGDSDQLPSVGAGNVLKDMIDSKVLKVIRLDEIFRQAKESMIVVNAHKINKGQNPILNKKDKDFYFIKKNKEEDILKEISELVSKRLPKFYNVDPIKDIQILAPMRKGNIGVNNINKMLQDVLNEESKYKIEESFLKRKFRVGDKVMQIKNNYTKEWKNKEETLKGEGVFNGDIGYIYHIEKQEKKVYIIFDDEKIVEYEYSQMDEVEHSFCTTIHKSQGSEFKIILIPITWAPPMLLMRNLLYTAITRAKELVILVGEYKYLDMMIKNNRIIKRNSSLKEKLQKFLNEDIIVDF
ncbi:MAG: ATP-dependent RecD-like DNA helicase [Peptostreptococcaceae bacterium]|jgi:exodeoxyribonuclease V alpha subunit|nr:ATP-dependent RecD-like DNA helicase [Peptostreptococcaceae bacterium]